MTDEAARFAALWEEYKGVMVKEIWKVTGPVAGCSLTIIVLAIIGQVVGWKTIGFVGLGFLGLVYFAHKAQFTVPGILLDIFMIIAVALFIGYTFYTSDQREGWVTGMFVVLALLYGVYLFNRAGKQIMFRTSKIQSRVFDGLTYPILPNGAAFEWFATKAGRAGAVVWGSDWSTFSTDMVPRVRHNAKFLCETCHNQVQVADPNNAITCGICLRPTQLLVICDKLPEEAAGDSATNSLESSQPENVARVPCSKCGAMVLDTTAAKYNGLCKPCWRK